MLTTAMFTELSARRHTALVVGVHLTHHYNIHTSTQLQPICMVLKQQTVSGSGISWAVRKSAPRSRLITIHSERTTYKSCLQLRTAAVNMASAHICCRAESPQSHATQFFTVSACICGFL